MTNEQLREALTARLSEYQQKVTERDDDIRKHTAAIKSLTDENAINLAHIEELTFALEQLPQQDGAASPHVAEPPKPSVLSPKGKCADEILAHYPDTIPGCIDDLPESIKKAYHGKTLRAGLHLAHTRRPKESRASLSESPSVIQPERTGARALVDSSPGESDGVGNPIGDMPDIPANPRRAPTREAVS